MKNRERYFLLTNFYLYSRNGEDSIERDQNQNLDLREKKGKKDQEDLDQDAVIDQSIRIDVIEIVTIKKRKESHDQNKENQRKKSKNLYQKKKVKCDKNNDFEQILLHFYSN